MRICGCPGCFESIDHLAPQARFCGVTCQHKATRLARRSKRIPREVSRVLRHRPGATLPDVTRHVVARLGMIDCARIPEAVENART